MLELHDRTIVQNGSLSFLEWFTSTFAMDFSNFSKEFTNEFMYFVNYVSSCSILLCLPCSKTLWQKWPKLMNMLESWNKNWSAKNRSKMSEILAILIIILCALISLTFAFFIIISPHLCIYFFIVRANFNKQFRVRCRCIHDIPQI